jgi:hypothetical protein
MSTYPSGNATEGEVLKCVGISIGILADFIPLQPAVMSDGGLAKFTAP